MEGEAGHFTHRKKYLLVIFSFVYGAEGDRATSLSSTSRNGSTYAPRLFVEVQMERDFMYLEGKVGHFAHGKNTTCLSFLPLFVV